MLRRDYRKLCYVEITGKFVCYEEITENFVCYVEITGKFVCYEEITGNLVCYEEFTGNFVCYEEITGKFLMLQIKQLRDYILIYIQCITKVSIPLTFQQISKCISSWNNTDKITL